jgi:hypothetical protein
VRVEGRGERIERFLRREELEKVPTRRVGSGALLVSGRASWV